MEIDQFIESYSATYLSMFYGEKIKVEEINTEEKSTLTKISDFLFTPRYEVNNLKFKLVG